MHFDSQKTASARLTKSIGYTVPKVTQFLQNTNTMKFKACRWSKQKFHGHKTEPYLITREHKAKAGKLVLGF